MSVCTEFVQHLIDQQPTYANLILEDIRPVETWLGQYMTGEWPAFSGVTHRLDRMKSVFPNITKQWTPVQYTNCLGTPCDHTRHEICMGSERVEFSLEEQFWRTPVLCFDQMRHVTHAVEQWGYILSDVLRPATNWITSNFLRRRTLDHASHRFAVGSTLSEFTFDWVVVGDEEIFFDTSADPATIGKLAPQHLQSRFVPLMQLGYGGKNPFVETAAFIDIVTGIETLWELDRLGGSTGVGGTPSLASNWRFTNFDEQSKFWRYGYTGQLGNFMARADVFELRFNFILDRGAGAAPNRFRYQVILPYENVETSGAGGAPGLGSIDNPDFPNARFSFTFVVHRKGLTQLVSEMPSINPEMPFLHRDLAGKWRFAMNNLTCGTDVNGNPIAVDNADMNKGQFRADFEMAVRPEYTEFLNVFFHKREPMCLPFIDVCSGEQGYPSQSYGSACEACPE